MYGHTGLREFLDTIGLAHTEGLFLTSRNLDAERARADRPGHRSRTENNEVEDVALALAAAIAANAPLLDARQQTRDRPPQRQTRN